MNAKFPGKIHSSLKLITHFWLWLFCSMVQMNLGDIFLCLRLLKSTKPVNHDRKNERDWSKEHQEEKSQREKWLGSRPEIYWQIRVKTKGAQWGPNYGSQKAKQEVCLCVFYQQVCGSQNKRVGEELSVVASSALSWFTFSDLLSTFVSPNECLKSHWSSEVTPSHRNVNWEVSLRLALSHKGTTYAVACEKAL